MKLVVLKCQACDANLDVQEGQHHVTCQHCGTRFYTDDKMSHVTSKEVEEVRPAAATVNQNEGRPRPIPTRIVEVRPDSSPNSKAIDNTGGSFSTRRLFIIGAVLFVVFCTAAATQFRLRVLGLSVQEWCVFTFAAVLARYCHGGCSRTAKTLSIAYWVFASFILALQIIMWVKNRSFTLLLLP